MTALTDIQLARFCWQAYGDKPFDLPAGWAHVASHEREAYVLRNGTAACVVFRGTVPDQLLDWLANIFVLKRGANWGRVHGGAFYRSTRLYHKLAPYLGEVSRLYLTGHSLGGQLATALAHLYFQGGRYDVDLVTFGAPKALSFFARRGFPDYIHVREYLDRRDPVGYVPVLNYWRLNAVRFGRWGLPRVSKHGSMHYFHSMALVSRKK